MSCSNPDSTPPRRALRRTRSSSKCSPTSGVVQPDIGRVGGLTEARRVCELAAAAGCLVVPHAWKTGISVAVAAHLAMATPHMPFFEFLPSELCESRLRKELTRDELVFEGGTLAPPQRAGARDRPRSRRARALRDRR